MKVFAKAILPVLLFAVIVKLIMPYLITPIMGYEGIFLSSFLVNLGFVLVVTWLLFKGGCLEKILTKAHA